MMRVIIGVLAFAGVAHADEPSLKQPTLTIYRQPNSRLMTISNGKQILVVIHPDGRVELRAVSNLRSKHL